MGLDLIKGGRAKKLAIMIGAIMIIFAVRLFYLQIVQHEYYVKLANSEQLKQLIIPAKRGEIYALNGSKPVRLVMNETVYTVFADPKIIDNPDKVAATLRRVAGGNLRRNIEGLLEKKQSRYQIMATRVSRKQAEMIKNEKLKGIGFQAETQRVYPEGKLAAQTLGFVNTEGKGLYGVEQALSDRLIGQDGLLQSVTDVRNVPLTIGDNNINRPAKNGDNIVLTIDRNVQAYAEKALARGLERTKATHGSVIIMDPQSGEIKAMANAPTYNPAEYFKVTDPALFNNGTISAPYEPGSDIKLLTVAAGLDKNVIRPNSTYNNTDQIKVEDRTITNATKGQTGTITMQHALNYSLNTAMIVIAQRLGDGDNINYKARQTLYDYFHNKFRLGERTGVELANEARGTIISPDQQDGNAVRYSNMAFGQGMDVTMVQTVAAFGALVNGGTYYKPTVVAGTVREGGLFSREKKPPVQTNVISKQAADETREMAHIARTTFHGAVDRPGYYIGGKTGTSQTIENGKYVDDQTVGSYLGFGGDATPRYVIMVKVSGKGMNLQGARDAMPIFTDISNWMLDYLKLQPRN